MRVQTLAYTISLHMNGIEAGCIPDALLYNILITEVTYIGSALVLCNIKDTTGLLYLTCCLWTAFISVNLSAALFSHM